MKKVKSVELWGIPRVMVYTVTYYVLGLVGVLQINIRRGGAIHFILCILYFIVFSKQNRVINLSIRNKMEKGTI